MKPARFWSCTVVIACGLLASLGFLLFAVIFFGRKTTEGAAAGGATWQERLVHLAAQSGYRVTPPEKRLVYEGAQGNVAAIRMSVSGDAVLPPGTSLAVTYLVGLKEVRVDFVNGSTVVFAHFDYDPETREVRLREEARSLTDMGPADAVAGSPLTRSRLEEHMAAIFDLVNRAGGP